MKKNKCLLIAAVIGTAYLVYVISHFAGAVTGSDATRAAGGALASMIVAPHVIATLVAVIFNWIGFAMNARWAALTAAILYAVALVLFALYFMFVIVEMILCFVGYAQMKKAETTA